MAQRQGNPKIAPSLALTIAGQVTAGTALGADGEPGAELTHAEVEELAERARTALLAIGLTVYEATRDPDVRATLDLVGSVRVRRDGDATVLERI